MNESVTEFLNTLNHPLAGEITALRQQILSANGGLQENIKWNAPNYIFNGEDRITMRINPPKQLQLIFHLGAKVLEEPEDRLIQDESKLLTWKTNDRAVFTFINREAIEKNKKALNKIINNWLEAAT